MPTPDTDTLAARLRAVERALTDADADPEADRSAAPGLDPDPGSIPNQAPPADPATGGEPGIERRLCRLEAAVQALQGALDEEAAAVRPSPEERDRSRPDPTATNAHPERSRRATGRGQWPDDLDTE